ncbi:hypothetical protein COO09_01780 [Rhizorhabdus dicambivorans]|uniref:Uncharacterized protein n=2 Tax=Rhizorhabdus dicambivorans TaxID=1850238 RepID=A0A2A4G130_9SPHN|nr:hypothetical protein CMV14_12395 [Rhizorhabdus dicambivorans]PCE44445.1 hypothetical protein COO09_01780 [Rhizorhabdus dicambivorans]
MALMVSACGPKQLALPGDPIGKAATCAVVSAAAARQKSPDVTGDLGFDDQTRILHYAMLAASDGGAFSAKRASEVVSRMGEVEADVTGGKWQALVNPCDQAYPQVKKTAGIELPKARFDAALGCYSLGDFLVKTVQTREPRAQETLSELMKMRRDLDGTVGSGLRARGASEYEKTLALKQKALGKMVKLGAPAETVKACTSRFA